MRFEFATAGRILFGEGRARELPEITRSLGRRPLVVRGSGDRFRALLAELESSSLRLSELPIRGEPEVQTVEDGVELACRDGCDLVLAIGGGSVIDAGKAIAALLTNPGNPRQYLEVVGQGKPLTDDPLPVVAVPTTAGTGAEVTRNAVLGVPEQRVKVSLRSPRMLPVVALVDPELTYSLPPDITASTGLDALTQCIEPFVTPQANPLTDAITREGMRRAARSLQRAFEDGGDREARRDMSIASLCGGLALANAKLGAVHGIAGPLGGMTSVPHGVACARLLPPVIETNLRALRAHAPGSPALARYEEVARILTGRESARAEEAAEWVAALVEALGVPRLGTYGVDEEISRAVIPRALRASSMKGNPVELTEEEIAGILAIAR